MPTVMMSTSSDVFACPARYQLKFMTFLTMQKKACFAAQGILWKSSSMSHDSSLSLVPNLLPEACTYKHCRPVGTCQKGEWLAGASAAQVISGHFLAHQGGSNSGRCGGVCAAAEEVNGPGRAHHGSPCWQGCPHPRYCILTFRNMLIEISS